MLVSRDPATAVAVRAADCVPLLMADPVTGAVAAVHAGWRGTSAGAAVAAVEALAREHGTRPEDLVVAIGPCIGSCCYEVGTELVDAFAAAGHERYLIDRWFLAPAPPRGSRERPGLRLDLAGANRDQLILAGVDETRIHACGLCTAMHPAVLTSYRAEGAQAGRLAGVILATCRQSRRRNICVRATANRLGGGMKKRAFFCLALAVLIGLCVLVLRRGRHPRAGRVALRAAGRADRRPCSCRKAPAASRCRPRARAAMVST